MFTKKSFLISLILILGLLFAMLPVGKVSAADLCVNPGGTDGCHATIQAAIDAALAGDTVTIANGTYVGSLNIYKNLTLRGESEAGVIIDTSGLNDYGIDASGDLTTYFSYFTLIGPLPDDYGYGLKVSGENALTTIQHVTVKNSGRSGIDLNGLNGVLVDNVTLIDNGGVGLALTDSSNLTVSNITTSGNAWGGMAIYTKGESYTGGSDNITLSGTNSFAEPIKLYIEEENGYSVTDFTQTDFGFTVENEIDAPGSTGFFATQAEAIAAALYSINPLASVITDLTTNSYYVVPGMSIQAAIDAATPGSTVNVAAGTYVEYLVINKDLSLLGSPGAIIQKPSGGDVFYLLPDDGTSRSFRPIVLAYGGSITSGDGTSAATGYKIQGIDTVNVKISGFTIDGGDAWASTSKTAYADGILMRNVIGEVSSNAIDGLVTATPTSQQFTIGIEMRGDNSNIDVIDNVVTGFGRTGIYMAGNNGTPVATITGNSVMSAYYGPYLTNGIEMAYDSMGTIEDNDVTGATGEGTIWTGTCIMLFGANNTTIYDNRVSTCDVGISVGSRITSGITGLNNTVIANEIDNCTYSSIEVNGNVSNTKIQNNVITNVVERTDTEIAGIMVLEYSNPAYGYPDVVLIEGNTISGDLGFWGIDIYRNADNITIQGNTITGGAVGVALELKENNSIGKTAIIGGEAGKGNSFVGQTEFAVSTGPYDYDSIPYQWLGDVTATYNWWGTAVRSLIGSKVSSNVLFDPYYIIPFTTLSEPLPPVVWVDDDYTYSPESCGGHICGYDGFITIQEGIDGVADGGIVNVAAGTYDDGFVYVYKAVDLRGPNYGIAGMAAVRNAEAIIVGPSDDWLTAYIDAGGVSIDGFKFDGQFLDPDGFYTVGIYGAADNLTFQNNIFNNHEGMSILTSGGDYSSGLYITGVIIKDNLITNDIPSQNLYNHGIYLQSTVATVTGNEVENVRVGIQVQPYRTPGVGLVKGNSFSAYRNPMWFNYSDNDSANWSFEDNILTGIARPVGEADKPWNGIRVETYTKGNVTFTGNTINIGEANASEIYMLKKVNETGGTIDLEATLNSNTWEKVVVVRDSLGFIRETTDLLVDPKIYDDSTFFSTIQSAIDNVYTVNGDTVDVGAGTYVENVVVDKSVSIDGAGSSTIVLPAVSNPGVGLGGSLGGSNVFLVQANDVEITDLVIDGDNPDLTSGVLVGGADLDARNGIITNHATGTYSGLEVSYVTVKNIYLRGIYASSGGTFNIHHNTITNTQGYDQSFAIMVYEGTGIVADNIIDYGSALGANYSQGTQWLRNTLTNTPGGIHTDNAGSPSILGDEVISGNTVDCTGVTGGYGVWTFVNRMPITVENNTVIGCEVAYSAWGSINPHIATFTNNTATAPSPNTGSVGIYVTTSGAGWGYYDVNANFSGNTITGFETGIYFSADQTTWDPLPYVAKTITSTISRNNIVGSTDYAVYMGTDGTYNTDVEENWWGSILGPQAPISEDVDVIQWCGTANPTCLPLLPVDNTITLDGTEELGDALIYVPNLTITIEDGATIANDGACFNINASYTTIQAESKLGAVCKPASGFNGINVADDLLNIVILNLAFDGSGGGVDGIHFDGGISDLMIADNWFHALNGDAIEFTAQPTLPGEFGTPVLSIQGNLFEENGGYGINAATFAVPAQYNSWGHVDGADAGDGKTTGVDADPYTHVDIYVGASGVVSVGGDVTVTIYGNLENVMGANFTLHYDPIYLDLDHTSLLDLSDFVPGTLGMFIIDETAGTITFEGTIEQGGTAISGEGLPLYSATFNVITSGAVLILDETTDKFIMLPDTDPAPSTNIYALKLVGGELTDTCYTVTGTISMQGRSIKNGIPATLTGLTLYGPYTAISNNNLSNNLSFACVAPGSYTFTTNQPRYLNVAGGTYGVTKTMDLTTDTILPSLRLIAGNAAWANNRIDAGDSARVGTCYGYTTTCPYDETFDGDVNFDGTINILDLTIVGGNFYKTSLSEYGSWLP